jgi:hypothetical protein
MLKLLQNRTADYTNYPQLAQKYKSSSPTQRRGQLLYNVPYCGLFMHRAIVFWETEHLAQAALRVSIPPRMRPMHTSYKMEGTNKRAIPISQSA